MSSISERSRDILARSLPLVQQYKSQLIESMEASFRAAGGVRQARARVAASLLTETLLEQACNIVEFGSVARLTDVAREHAMAGIDARHYGTYGDALAPVLRDLLGDQLPSAVTWAWGDAYWAVVRMIAAPSKLAA